MGPLINHFYKRWEKVRLQLIWKGQSLIPHHFVQSNSHFISSVIVSACISCVKYVIQSGPNLRYVCKNRYVSNKLVVKTAQQNKISSIYFSFDCSFYGYFCNSCSRRLCPLDNLWIICKSNRQCFSSVSGCHVNMNFVRTGWTSTTLSTPVIPLGLEGCVLKKGLRWRHRIC